MKLIPAGKRSEVMNAALRKELLHRKRELAAAWIKKLRKESAKFTGREIVEAVRRGRSRLAK